MNPVFFVIIVFMQINRQEILKNEVSKEFLSEPTKTTSNLVLVAESAISSVPINFEPCLKPTQFLKCVHRSFVICGRRVMK